ncbi:hypothetical protein Tco_0581474 [Tanacetum coccineum]
MAEEEAAKAALSNEYDFIQARLNADKILVEKLQKEERAADASKKKVKKDDSVKGEIKEEKGTRKRKLGTRKKMKSKKRKFTSKDDEELRLYQDETPEGFDKILWGDVDDKINQRLVIHMLVENKYPLKKEVLSKLLELKLETEEDSTMALELIRFVKK